MRGPLAAILGFGGLPLPCMLCAGSARCLGVPPALPSGSGGSPPPAQECHALGAHSTVQGGPPLRLGLARTSPAPSCPRAVCVCCLGWGGALPRPGPCRAGGSHAGVIREVSLCPRYAPWARTAGLGVPLFLLLWAAACFRCRQPFGAEARLGLSSVGLLRFESSLGAPIWIQLPFAQRVPRCSDWGYPPVPLLRALGPRFWIGVPPPPSPPWRPLTLGARDRSGGGGSTPSLCRRAPVSRSHSGVFRPPPPPVSVPCCGVWTHGRPLLSQALIWLSLYQMPLTLPCHIHGAGACHFRS